jgi:hypothetical protein
MHALSGGADANVSSGVLEIWFESSTKDMPARQDSVG